MHDKTGICVYFLPLLFGVRLWHVFYLYFSYLLKCRIIHMFVLTMVSRFNLTRSTSRRSQDSTFWTSAAIGLMAPSRQSMVI
jgi:hypothetical protein